MPPPPPCSCCEHWDELEFLQEDSNLDPGRGRFVCADPGEYANLQVYKHPDDWDDTKDDTAFEPCTLTQEQKSEIERWSGHPFDETYQKKAKCENWVAAPAPPPANPPPPQVRLLRCSNLAVQWACTHRRNTSACVCIGAGASACTADEPSGCPASSTAGGSTKGTVAAVGPPAALRSFPCFGCRTASVGFKAAVPGMCTS